MLRLEVQRDLLFQLELLLIVLEVGREVALVENEVAGLLAFLSSSKTIEASFRSCLAFNCVGPLEVFVF